MSIIAYGYGRGPGTGGGGTTTVELGDVELTTADVVVELNPEHRIIDLPADLAVTLTAEDLQVSLGGALTVEFDDGDVSIDLE